jgi:hypothetical protein
MGKPSHSEGGFTDPLLILRLARPTDVHELSLLRGLIGLTASIARVPDWRMGSIQ